MYGERERDNEEEEEEEEEKEEIMFNTKRKELNYNKCASVCV
jgi:hypothetical protein